MHACGHTATTSRGHLHGKPPQHIKTQMSGLRAALPTPTSSPRYTPSLIRVRTPHQQSTVIHQRATDNDGIVKGSEAVKFFRGSGAPDHVLSYVWRVASRDSHALSSDTELRTALGLLLEARNGRLPFAGAVRHDADTARRAAAAAIAQHPDIKATALPPEASATYSALFSRLAHEDCEYVELADLKRFLAASWLQESAVDAVLRAVVGEEDEIDASQFAAVVHITLAAVEAAKTIAQSMCAMCLSICC